MQGMKGENVSRNRYVATLSLGNENITILVKKGRELFDRRKISKYIRVSLLEALLDVQL